MKKPTSTLSETASPTEDQLAGEAARIDGARATQEKDNPVDQVISGELPADGAEPGETTPTADPMMVMSLTMLVSSGVKILHAKYDWTLPPEEWKSNVATLAATILDRYIPMMMAGQTDVIALLLLVGPYVIENLIRTAGRSDRDTRDKGLGKDNFIEPAPEDPLTRFPHPA